MEYASVKRLISLLLPGLLLAASAQADKVMLNLSARISVAPCTVSPVLVAGLPVSLGTLSAGDLQDSGDADPKYHPFALELTHCPLGTNRVTAKFSGTRDRDDIRLFANTASSNPASNIAVEVSRQSDPATLISHNSVMIVNVDASSGTAAFLLAARMKSPKGNATGGNVSTTMTVDFTYQ